MRIKMSQSIRGAIDGHWSPSQGDVLEVSDPAGALLVERGFAEETDEDPEAEPEVETATPDKDTPKSAPEEVKATRKSGAKVEKR